MGALESCQPPQPFSSRPYLEAHNFLNFYFFTQKNFFSKFFNQLKNCEKMHGKNTYFYQAQKNFQKLACFRRPKFTGFCEAFL